ncbi:MAG: SAM-dependent chlorinase/fluorinase [Candidatus Korobacteraceae bacterium]|jgi:S-adenosyl-L-methionine hydrolase (adenosine-forming)
MSESRIVTFTTDFGLNDPFVGILHGVVLNIHPATMIVDVCHAVASYDVLDGAWTIAQAYRFFPPQTVHVVVIDPGVGSERRPLIAETDDHIFVAPDNGVLSLIEAREPKFAVRHVIAERYFLQPVSHTFHGRDVFAAVAGWLSKGVAPSEFGPEVSDYVRLPLPPVERLGQNSLRGVVLKVDKFGNLITNIGESDAPGLFDGAFPVVSILIAGVTITRLCQSYAQGEGEEIFAIVGSSGYLEIAAKQASAAEKLAAGVGTPVGIVIGG